MPGFRIHHGLEHRAENDGRNLVPLQLPAFQQQSSGFCIERRNTTRFPEQAAVNVWESSKSGCFALSDRRLGLGIKNDEKTREKVGQIRAISLRERLDGSSHLAWLGKNSRVFGKKAEEKPGQKDVKLVNV